MCDHIDSEDEDETPEEKTKRVARETMEEDGFTLVTADDLNPNRIKVRDGATGTTILGVTVARAKEFYEGQKERQKLEAKYVSGKDQKELIKRDFYMFQKRLVQKDSVEKLREGFEDSKKRLQKSMDKSARRATREGLNSV